MEHDRCAACGIPGLNALSDRWPPGLQTHHIIKPGRSDEPCNLLRLCERCHRLAEGERVPRGRALYWPTLPLAVCLALKLAADPEEWNPERLAVLAHRTLPELAPIPAAFLEERQHWHYHPALCN
jgi:hypothetical protein